MQQYALFPITKPFVVAQRTFFSLHSGQKDMPIYYHFPTIFRRNIFEVLVSHGLKLSY
jgi:hypothetical protein